MLGLDELSRTPESRGNHVLSLRYLHTCIPCRPVGAWGSMKLMQRTTSEVESQCGPRQHLGRQIKELCQPSLPCRAAAVGPCPPS